MTTKSRLSFGLALRFNKVLYQRTLLTGMRESDQSPVTLGWTSCRSTGQSNPSLGFARTLQFLGSPSCRSVRRAHDPPAEDRRVSEGFDTRWGA